jgi:hypothetical protein
VPDAQCPVPTAQLENYRRTIVRRIDSTTEDLEETYTTETEHGRKTMDRKHGSK